ncbi:hypothetical protein BDZ89DRAFT_1074583 [Hymenopellis radicata]|nr:hypothetical protein BDZ89DRAFT_1074583 [Hymenopellis radicata]
MASSFHGRLWILRSPATSSDSLRPGPRVISFGSLHQTTADQIVGASPILCPAQDYLSNPVLVRWAKGRLPRGDCLTRFESL